VPVAPGTVASAAAILLGYLLHRAGGFPLLAGMTVAVVALGHWAIHVGLRRTPGEDPGEIVIDEVAGQLLALFPLSAGLWWMGAAPQTFPWPGWVGAFVTFRLFDIWKPGPVAWAAGVDGPGAVMADDLVAGALAALAVAGAAALAHGVLM
jgi:phosphatidylglycerophosphatase A